jgi:predicted NUDIX family phosphoesterase
MFGGHLQATDVPGLFAGNSSYEQDFLFRELREELRFEPTFEDAQYLGILHLTDTKFERQHAGVVFAIQLSTGTRVRSLEPGYHSSLNFISWLDIENSPVMDDRWSAAITRHIKGSVR